VPDTVKKGKLKIVTWPVPSARTGFFNKKGNLKAIFDRNPAQKRNESTALEKTYYNL
jgi:hypothetical protein